MAKDFTARITGDSERASRWRQVLGSDTVNIKSPIPAVANLPDLGDRLVYEMDLSLLTDSQRARLIDYISERFTINTSYVSEMLDTIGCPIIADDITVTVQNPQKWL